jgi:hypothetical protein
MSDHPLYMNAYGSISKVLNKMIEAKRPERFTQDFLETVLALPSSSLRPIIPLLKRIGFLNSDGSPTDLYSKFKTEGARKAAMAAGLRIGYPEIFKRNEYAYKLDKSKLTDIVVEMTGLEKNNGVVRSIVGTFSALNEFADFDQPLSDAKPERIEAASKPVDDAIHDRSIGQLPSSGASPQRVGMNLAYTINLNLPESTNIEVFNTIFRSLKENLLR